MRNHIFAVLDTETTGFSPQRGDRLIEVAVVKIINGEVARENYFSTFVNPEGKRIPPSATRVNKITDDMVEDAPLFQNIVTELIDFLKEVDYLFIHNASFDLKFLKHEFKKLEMDFLLPKIVCSVNLSKELYPSAAYHNLDAVAKRFNLSIKEGELRHRALGDVILTGEAILNFYQENPLMFLGTIEQLSENH